MPSPSVADTPAEAAPGRELFELVSALVCLVEHGRIVFINTAGVRMLGLDSAEDALGRDFKDFMAADYHLLLEAGWELLAEEDFLPLLLHRGEAVRFEAEMRVRRVPLGGDEYLLEARDVSKAKRSAEALREREERLQAILASVAEGIVTIGQDGIVETANPAAERMFRLARGKLAGLRLGDLTPIDCQEHDEHLGVPINCTFETQGRRSDGSAFPMEMAVSELRHGKARLFTGVVRDISERKENEERIRRLAHHDSLTGLPNRNLLDDRMNLALARIRRHGGRMAVLFVDLDRFKPINDTLGHEAGDVVLREVARRLTGCVRGSDTVARVGGDEFVVVVEELGRGVDAAVVARKIIEAMVAPVPFHEHECRVGASVGVAVFPDDGYTLEDVCKAADIAMYRVKRLGRNGYCFYGDDEEGAVVHLAPDAAPCRT